jgi:5'-nucleotidase
MKRRTFIQTGTAAGILTGIGGLGLLTSSFKNPSKHITILHTNDVHSHIESFPADDAKFPNLGGVSRRYTLIEKIRKENPNTLLLDAGDIFQGTPFFNFYGGELEFKLMSKLKYDSATIGNHDFDNGIDGLNAQLPNAEFSFISSNYNFKNTVLEGKVKDYQIFKKDGVKIGVFGLGVELDGLVSKRNYKETKYLNPVEIAQEMTSVLKQQEKCDLVICLSHLGYSYESDKIDDLKLAAQTKNIDLIIGGHTHTFLQKPTVTENLEGKKVLVNQTGWAGVNLGRIDFYLDEENNVSSDGAAIMV